jgi:hypothetical protein
MKNSLTLGLWNAAMNSLPMKNYRMKEIEDEDNDSSEIDSVEINTKALPSEF